MLFEESRCPVFKFMSIEKCCGCEGCVNSCPSKALTMAEDSDGFLYPVMNESNCINCNKCVNNCPMLNAVPSENSQERYLEFSHTDVEVLVKSSSGGLFTYIYDMFLKQYPNGYVAGAVYTKDCKRIDHILSNNEKDFFRMRGSKYFQSYKRTIYTEVKHHLEDHLPVLFTGAPCEVDALYLFLGKEYDELWTLDYICKGSSTPRMLREYVEHLNNKYKSEAIEISMRYKWTSIDNFIPQFVKVNFENGKHFLHEFYNTELGLCFQIVQRRSCPDCPYREKMHPADFTIGDYHEHAVNDPVFNHLGTSVLILNTVKGIKLWDSWKKDNIKYRDISKEEVYRHNRNPLDTRSEKLREYIIKDDCITAVRRVIGIKEKIKMSMPVAPLRKITAWRRNRNR